MGRLVLSRKPKEEIILRFADSKEVLAVITIVEMRRALVRLGVQAPEVVEIVRGEHIEAEEAAIETAPQMRLVSPASSGG